MVGVALIAAALVAVVLAFGLAGGAATARLCRAYRARWLEAVRLAGELQRELAFAEQEIDVLRRDLELAGRTVPRVTAADRVKDATGRLEERRERREHMHEELIRQVDELAARAEREQLAWEQLWGRRARA